MLGEREPGSSRAHTGGGVHCMKELQRNRLAVAWPIDYRGFLRGKSSAGIGLVAGLERARRRAMPPKWDRA
jgi:hypothetical protein